MSPLRIVISAYASSRRSIAANKRPNGVLEGVNGMEAVLDIEFPFLEAAVAACDLEGKLCMPDARDNRFVCMAAFLILHRNIGRFESLMVL
jgi:hypothetical protein